MTNLKALSIYKQIVATQPGIERKGKANPYTSMNGNMFSFITKEGELKLNLEDEIQKGAAITHDGAVVNTMVSEKIG